MHDRVKRRVIPYAEFATNSHTVNNISKYLLNFKNNSQGTAPFIVLDESWAPINSIMETFNNCSALSYMNWTWDVIHLDFENNKEIHCCMITILCHTHLFENIVDKTNKIIKQKKCKKAVAIKSLFQFCFTLIQRNITERLH